MSLSEEFYTELNNTIKQMRLVKEASEGIVRDIIKKHSEMEKSYKPLKADINVSEKINKVVKATKAARTKRKK